MMLKDIYHLVDELSREDLDALADYIDQQRDQRQVLQYTRQQRIQMIDQQITQLGKEPTPEQIKEISEAIDGLGERRNAPLDIEELKQIFAELREGFTEKDLEELEWAMNVEYIEPLDDDL